MGDVKEFPLVPDPSGDRQVWECELTMLERCEGLYEGLADRDRMVVYLAESILPRTPLDPDPTREMLNIGEHDLVNITDALRALRQRKTTVQQQLTARGGAR